MNHRHLTSLAAAAILLASASVRAQSPTTAAPPAAAADPATTPTQAAAPSVETPKPPPPPAPAPQPVMNTKWKTTLYGFVEMGVVYDSTKSFTDGFQNNTIVHPTFNAASVDAYENKRLQFNVKNSRVGFNFAAPEYESIKATAQIEADFFGPQAGTSEYNFYGQPSLRMRHFWFKLEMPVIDVLVGQFHDLFAWGGGGFYPATVGYLAVSGEVYNRRPQIRLSKPIKSDAITVEPAASVSRPFQRDSMFPDLMGGLKVTLNNWKGARAQGDGPASVGAAAIGVSGIFRKFKVNDLPAPTVPMVAATPATYSTANGWGVAGNLFMPIVPATGDDLSNALTLVAEFSYGQGINDMYNGLSGGARFPAAGPAPAMGTMGAATPYTANVDGGAVVFDAAGNLVPIKWMAALGNLHYHLPFVGGKLMRVSAIGSLIKSDNIVAAHEMVLSEAALNGTIWKQKIYADFNWYLMITPATQLSLSGQWAQQTWADDTKSTHLRGEANFHFFF